MQQEQYKVFIIVNFFKGFVSGWEEDKTSVVDQGTKRGSTPSLVESFILAWVAGTSMYTLVRHKVGPPLPS